MRMHRPEELRELAESYLAELALTPELHGQAESVRYALTMGGKRVRPVICLATAEAAGAEPELALPAAAAVELVHNFSLVHDDLPALDNDEVRRGNPSVWARYGEAIAVLAGDALLAEAFRLALSSPTQRCSPTSCPVWPRARRDRSRSPLVRRLLRGRAARLRATRRRRHAAAGRLRRRGARADARQRGARRRVWSRPTQCRARAARP